MARLLSGILVIVGIALAALAIIGMSEAQNGIMQAAAQDNTDKPPAEEAAPAGTDAAPAGGKKNEGETGQATGGSPLETAKAAEKGTLSNPHTDYEAVAAEGRKIFMAAGCNGCHGGTGGGGMGPPLTNPVWIYGSDDDTLFRLIALGSDGLQEQGYARKGSEAVVGPMPAQGTIVKSDDDIWKIIAWIRSINPSSADASSASIE